MDARIRAISPVLGVLLMVALTLVLAAVFASGALTAGEGLGEKRDQFEEAAGRSGSGTQTAVSTATGNPWAGERGDLLRPSDPAAGATDVTYRMNLTVTGENAGGDTNQLNSVEVRMIDTNLDMFSGVTESDLDRVVVDKDSDGSIDADLTGSVSAVTSKNGGATLRIEFTNSGYYDDLNDSIIAEFDGVDNPASPGDYDVEAKTSGDGNWFTGTVTIV